METKKISLKNSPRAQALRILQGLTLQFVLGMALNLFTEPPEKGKPESIWSSAIFAAHGFLGIFILIGSLALFIKSRKSDDAAWKKSAMLGFISVLVAALGGIGVAAMGETNMSEVASFIMSLGFIAAFISYGWYFVTKR